MRKSTLDWCVRATAITILETPSAANNTARAIGRLFKTKDGLMRRTKLAPSARIDGT